VALFLKGLAIGLAIAAPVGPIGLLCIRRTLALGRLAGLTAGLGAATADAVYGFIAAFGLTFVAAFLIEQRAWFALGGGVFLCYVGLAEWFARPPSPEDAAKAEAEAAAHEAAGIGALFSGFFTTFLLTLANPMTILSFAAIFAGLGLPAEVATSAEIGGAPGRDGGALVQLVGGVFLGSAAWWLALSGGVGLIRHRLGPGRLRWLNRVSGVALIGFGLYALSQTIR